MKRNSILRFEAQDTILDWAVSAALAADERGDEDLAGMIRHEATKLAKKWHLSNVSGLPDTFEKKL